MTKGKSKSQITQPCSSPLPPVMTNNSTTVQRWKRAQIEQKMIGVLYLGQILFMIYPLKLLNKKGDKDNEHY
ncbi:MAG: hypothetical protein ABI618_16590, partial [Nitrospirota bacterium]